MFQMGYLGYYSCHSELPKNTSPDLESIHTYYCNMADAARAALVVRRNGFAGSLTVESMNQKLRTME